MPLLLQKQILPEGLLGIWKITEPESWFLSLMPLLEAEQQELKGIKGRRRLEWLAGRWMLHLLSGRKTRGAVHKDAWGKPGLSDSTYHISISHSHELAAVIASPLNVGIDIQYYVDKIDRLAPKFVRLDEEAFLLEETRMEQLHLLWCAKEALYKGFGRRKLDFKEHLRVHPFVFSVNGGNLTGEIRKGQEIHFFDLTYEVHENYFMVYGIQVA